MSSADEIGSAFMRILGVDGPDTVGGLLRVAPDDLWQKLPPMLPMAPVIDGDIVPHASTFQTLTSRLAKSPWCDAVMLGQSELDVSTMKQSITHANVLG